ncbi:HNH endonuclease [[Kitasatospora] papulosa]|uniref:HNH endonuclease n=1 Tax=[Kitasatospora] papulosa TaxID=1464011 RepID=UPI0039A64FF9
MPLYLRDALEDEGIIRPPITPGRSTIRLSAPLISWGSRPKVPASVSYVLMATGAGKTETFIAAAKAAGLGRRLTTVRRWASETQAPMETPWADLDGTASTPSAAAGLLLVPEPYAPQRLRTRTTPTAQYRALCRKAAEWETSGRDQDRREVAGDRRVRNPASRRAVRLRSGGRCENPSCLLPELPYRTKAGEPLLEIDHIDGHASGGRDHPSAMIALCPNCHTNKTHGAERTALTERLRKVATERHATWESSTE